MAILMRRIVLVGLGFLTGCERAPTPLEYTREHTVVYSVLSAGTAAVAVQVMRSDPNSSEARPVSGAEVLLRRDAEAATRLIEGTGATPGECGGDPVPPLAGRGCYRGTLLEPVEPGARYHLLIALPSGDTVRGTAAVPRAPAVTEPQHGSRYPVRCAREDRCEAESIPGQPLVRLASVGIRWESSADAARIELDLLPGDVYGGGGRLADARCRLETFTPFAVEDRSGAADIGVYSVECTRPDATPVPWDSVAARVVVAAFDTAYARYAASVLESESVRESQAAAGIQGALGVFAGVALTDQRIIFIRQREPAASAP